MKLRVAGPASADIAAAFRYLRERNPVAAHGVRSSIRQAIRSLRRMPNRGRASSLAGLRELVVRGAPYVIVYAVGEEEVIVLRVRHTSQDPSP